MDESLVPLKLMANAVERNFQVIAIKIVAEKQCTKWPL